MTIIDFLICPHCRSIEAYDQTLIELPRKMLFSLKCQNCEHNFFGLIRENNINKLGKYLVQSEKDKFTIQDIQFEQLLTFNDIFGKC